MAVWADGLWRHGRVWMAVGIGAPAGLFFGLLSSATSGVVAALPIGGLFFGEFFGGVLAWVSWRRWPLATALAPDDRVAVVHAVRTGGDVGDARLAGAVLEAEDAARRLAGAG